MEHVPQFLFSLFELAAIGSQYEGSSQSQGSILWASDLAAIGARREAFLLKCQLHDAAKDGDFGIVQRLIGEEMGDRLAFEDGSKALLQAAMGGHLDVVRYLAELSAKEVEKHKLKASYEGHCVRWLTERLADEAARRNIENAALMLAACKGHQNVVRYLADNGANLAVTNDEGQTALMLAAAEGHVDVVRLLVKDLGAAMDPKAKNGQSALMYAADNDKFDVVRFLEEELVLRSERSLHCENTRIQGSENATMREYENARIRERDNAKMRELEEKLARQHDAKPWMWCTSSKNSWFS